MRGATRATRCARLGQGRQSADFAADDFIRLDDQIFTGLGSGGLRALAPAAFHTGTQAGDADDRIIYNLATGDLFYDADGLGGAAQVNFAVLSTKPTVTASDFEIF